jgi:hypothetical protein
VTEFIGWVGNACFVSGVIVIGNKNRSGFVYCTLGNACYVSQAWMTSNVALLCLSLFLMGLNIRAFAKWGKS